MPKRNLFISPVVGFFLAGCISNKVGMREPLTDLTDKMSSLLLLGPIEGSQLGSEDIADSVASLWKFILSEVEKDNDACVDINNLTQGIANKIRQLPQGAVKLEIEKNFNSWKANNFDMSYRLPAQRCRVPSTGPNCAKRQGLSLLELAMLYDYINIVRCLCQNKEIINLNLEDRFDNGPTALEFAILCGNLTIIQCLCENKANVNAQGPDNGLTPLHCAAGNGALEVVKYLCTHGADIDAQTHGITPLDRAVSEGNLEIVKYLCQEGVRIGSVTDAMLSRAHVLANQNGAKRVVRWIGKFRYNKAKWAN